MDISAHIMMAKRRGKCTTQFINVPFEILVHIYDYSYCSAIFAHEQWRALQEIKYGVVARNSVVYRCTHFLRWLEQSGLGPNLRDGDKNMVVKHMDKCFRTFAAKAEQKHIWHYFPMVVNYMSVVYSNVGDVRLIEELHKYLNRFLFGARSMYFTTYHKFSLRDGASKIRKRINLKAPHYVMDLASKISWMSKTNSIDIIDFYLRDGDDRKTYIEFEGQKSRVVSLADMSGPAKISNIEIYNWHALHAGHIYEFDDTIQMVKDIALKMFINLKVVPDLRVWFDNVFGKQYNSKYERHLQILHYLLSNRDGRAILSCGHKYEGIAKALTSYNFLSMLWQLIGKQYLELNKHIRKWVESSMHIYDYINGDFGKIHHKAVSKSLLIGYYLDCHYAKIEGGLKPLINMDLFVKEVQKNDKEFLIFNMMWGGSKYSF